MRPLAKYAGRDSRFVSCALALLAAASLRAEKPVLSAPRQTAGEAARHGRLAVEAYFGVRHAQNFYEARREASLGGSEPAAMVIQALCLGEGKGGDRDVPRALRLLAPLLLKDEPEAHAAAALVTRGLRSPALEIPPAFAAEFREELAAVPAYDPRERAEHARLALAGLQPKLQTDAVACFISAQLLAWGAGVPADETRAEGLYRRAWELGCSDGANQMGNLLNEGEPVRRDKAEALRWFRKGAEAGNAVAKLNLALFDTTLTPLAWRETMTAGAEAGHPDAMMWLGLEYWIGSRFPHNLTAARQWLEKSVACGRRDAMAQLGKLLRDDARNDAERRRGTQLLKQAVVRESDVAASYLALPYLLGEPDLSANPGIGLMLAAGAVDRGQADSFVALGVAYEKGLGMEKDPKKARQCYEAGIERGSVLASCYLGLFLTNGVAGEPDPRQAFPHFLKAAESGTYPPAMAEVGRRLLMGVGVARDEEAALRWLRKAAAARDLLAIATLGFAYETGAGVPVDLSQAVKLYRQSAQGGDPAGMVFLAACLAQGKGLPAAPVESFSWLRKAADLGEPSAFLPLSRAYETGSGTNVDPVAAWQWLIKGAQAGDANACFWLAEGLRTGRGGDREPEKAFRWFEKAARLGHPTATNNLGCCYQFGDGVTADPDKAFAHYLKAVELGEANALVNVAICYEKGIGTAVDLEKAREYRRRAEAKPPR